MHRILIFFLIAVLAQGTNAIAGVLIARWSGVEDYAVYTVMMIVVGSMAVLTNGGTVQAFNAIAGRAWPDRRRVAGALATAVVARRRISFLVLPPLLAITVYLLYCNQATAWTIFLMVGILLLQWAGDMRVTVLSQVLNFAGRQLQLKGVDGALALGRMFFVVVCNLAGVMYVGVMVALGVVVTWLRSVFIGRWVRQELPVDEGVQRQEDAMVVDSTVRRQLPNEVFFVLQGQVSLLVIGWFGSYDQTAGFGALTRLVQLILPFQMVMTSFAIPRFAATKQHVFRVFLAFWGLSSLPGVVLACGIWFAPRPFLILVGTNYAHLEWELFLFACSTMIASSCSAAWHLAANRAWNHFTWIQIPGTILILVLSACFLDLSRLSSVIVMQMAFGALPGIACLFDLVAAAKRGWDVTI